MMEREARIDEGGGWGRTRMGGGTRRRGGREAFLDFEKKKFISSIKSFGF